MTGIVADVSFGFPYLIADVAVSFGYSRNIEVMDFPIIGSSKSIHNVCQKIFKINENIFLSGSGDYDTIKEFAELLLRNRNNIDSISKLKDIYLKSSEIKYQGTEVIGIFVCNKTDFQCAFKINLRVGRNDPLQDFTTGDRFFSGSGAGVLRKWIEKLKITVRPDIYLSGDKTGLILGIINNAMLNDAGTQEAQSNKFGVAYTAVWKQNSIWKKIPNYIAIFGIIDCKFEQIDYRTLEWRKGSSFLLSVEHVGDNLRIRELKEGINEIKIWEIPEHVTNESSSDTFWTSKGDITIYGINSILACIDFEIGFPQDSGASTVPLVGRWEIGGNRVLSTTMSFPWDILESRQLVRLCDKAVREANVQWKENFDQTLNIDNITLTYDFLEKDMEYSRYEFK